MYLGITSIVETTLSLANELRSQFAPSTIGQSLLARLSAKVNLAY